MILAPNNTSCNLLRERLADIIEEAEGLCNNDFPTIEQITDYLISKCVTITRQGYWIKVADLCGIAVLKCSVCGKEHPRLPTAYCCDCGAKMEGEYS